MTKDEAIDAMREGKKVAHRHFTGEEWVKETGTRYEFEDGCMCEPREFWAHRVHSSWVDGWSVVN